MKLYSDPGRVVQKRDRFQGKMRIVPIFRFDENGIAEIDETKYSETDLSKFKVLFGTKPTDNITEELKPIVDDSTAQDVIKQDGIYCKHCGGYHENKGFVMSCARKRNKEEK